MHPLLRRLWSRHGIRSVAGQMFGLQVVVALVLVAAAVAALLLESRSDAEHEAQKRSLAVAASVASDPSVRRALTDGGRPGAALQQQAEETRRLSGVDFVVVMSPTGIRYTHPDPARIGQHFIGSVSAALHGGVVTETTAGTLGPSVRTVVPVTGPGGKVVGLVAAGITVHRVTLAAGREMPLVLTAAGLVLTAATGGSALIGRRLSHQTHGLGPVQMTRMYEHHDAVLHAVREGVLIVDPRGRLLLANDEAKRLLGLGADLEGRPVTDLGLDRGAEQLLLSGRETTDEVIEVGDRLLAVSQRPAAPAEPAGWVATLRDTTELSALMGRVELVQGRLRLLYDAGIRIGTTLDVHRTAEELAEFAVSGFADHVTVDLTDAVLRGEEPTAPDAVELRRVALGGARPDIPFYPAGDLIRFGAPTPQAACFGSGQPALEADLAAFSGWQAQDADRARRLVAHGVHSMVTVPLRARGVILGVVTFWRSKDPAPFTHEDLSVAEELVARAAVSIDNARRFAREHAMAVTLQRSLLPHALPEQNAVEVAHRYVPAEASLGGVGGDWFDVVPLPGARVAIVVGDVVGHGLHAAATMGQLRTAVQNLSTLDLPPDELLWHLDELVTRIDQDREGDGGTPTLTGATCLYAIYDPVSGRCTMARAGHLEPVLVHPDGHARLSGAPAGPPLGLGGLPYEKTEVLLPEGSSIVLYTDGLVEDRRHDIDERIERLRRAVEPAGRTPDQMCRAAMDTMLPGPPRDDVALVVARTRLLGDEHTVAWEVPSDPSAVAGVRAAAAGVLRDWGLEEEAFTLELILSELVTNAIRYASGPIGVRLIHDRSLICEVSDGSSVSPHLRRATSMEEGGRGLFLVARFADRWGTRYTAEGKVIWTEQRLAAAP